MLAARLAVALAVCALACTHPPTARAQLFDESLTCTPQKDIQSACAWTGDCERPGCAGKCILHEDPQLTYRNGILPDRATGEDFYTACPLIAQWTRTIMAGETSTSYTFRRLQASGGHLVGTADATSTWLPRGIAERTQHAGSAQWRPDGGAASAFSAAHELHTHGQTRQLAQAPLAAEAPGAAPGAAPASMPSNACPTALDFDSVDTELREIAEIWRSVFAANATGERLSPDLQSFSNILDLPGTYSFLLYMFEEPSRAKAYIADNCEDTLIDSPSPQSSVYVVFLPLQQQSAFYDFQPFTMRQCVDTFGGYQAYQSGLEEVVRECSPPFQGSGAPNCYSTSASFMVSSEACARAYGRLYNFAEAEVENLVEAAASLDAVRESCSQFQTQDACSLPVSNPDMQQYWEAHRTLPLEYAPDLGVDGSSSDDSSTAAIAGAVSAVVALAVVIAVALLLVRRKRRSSGGDDAKTGGTGLTGQTAAASHDVGSAESSQSGLKSVGGVALVKTGSSGTYSSAYGAASDLPSAGVQTQTLGWTTTMPGMPTDVYDTSVAAGETTAAAQKERLMAELDRMRLVSELFLDQYAPLPWTERREGGQGVVQFMRSTRTEEAVAVKFFLSRSAYETELQLYEVEVLRSMMPKVLLGLSNADEAARNSRGYPWPPCIVLEKGESLQEWKAKTQPAFSTILDALCLIVERLAHLHGSGWVHRDLKPGNVLRLPGQHSWTLMDFGCAARAGESTVLTFSPSYAPPEVALAAERGERTIVADGAADMWALGVMAFELLTGGPVFPPLLCTREAIWAQLCGRELLPWEDGAPGQAEKLAKLKGLKRAVLQCLQRAPEDRPAAADVLGYWRNLFESRTETA